MNGFSGFSEAARLCAQYSAVVDTMYKAFERDVDGFLDTLRDEVARLLAPALLQERQTPGYRYLWVAQEDQDKDSHPQLWFSTRDPKIVIPGELRMTAVAPQAEGEVLRRLAAVATDHPHRSYCKPAAGGKWSLFTVVVPYPPQDSVSQAAKPIADILIGLHNVYANK